MKVNTWTNEECRMVHSDEVHSHFYKGTLCAFADKGRGTCFADSGSPLTKNGQLIGVVHWGQPCAQGVPDAYLRISVFVDWIQEVSGAVAL